MSGEEPGVSTPNISHRLGKRIKELRQKAGLKQETLALSVGTTQSHFANIEKGDVNVGSDMLQRIADALELDISQLFELRSDMPPEILRAELIKMLGKADNEQLRLIFRIVDAIIY